MLAQARQIEGQRFPNDGPMVLANRNQTHMLTEKGVLEMTSNGRGFQVYPKW